MTNKTTQPKQIQEELAIMDVNAQLITNSGLYDSRGLFEVRLHNKYNITEPITTVRGITKDEAEAMAQRMVKCVNGEKKIDMHDELIEQLEKCANAMAHCISVLPDDWKEAIRKTKNDARKLLKQAEQK